MLLYKFIKYKFVKFKLYLTKYFIKMETNLDNIINASTCLLLAVSNADDNLDKKEQKIIKDILIDFFKIKEQEASLYFNSNIKKINESTDLYEFAQILNNNFTHQDKIDFIYCAYEVAFIDDESHYLEEHIIKKIAYILNIGREELVKSKNEMKKIFDL